MRTPAIRIIVLLLHLPSSLAFRVVNERRGALKFISPSSSSSSTTTTSAFSRQKKDEDEDDGVDSGPSLDIFGQSEEQKKRRKIDDGTRLDPREH